MRSELLVAAYAKNEWAQTQIDHLSRDIKDFFADNPYGVNRNIEPGGANDQPIEVWRFELSKPVPAPIYAQVSSILGSLREPLDQAVSAVNRQRGKSESGVGFVFGATQQEFARSLREAKRVPEDVRDAIALCEPFYGGNGALLAALHFVKNPDKHRSALVPIVVRSAAVGHFLAVMKGGRLLTFGPRNGTHLVPTGQHNDLHPPSPEQMPDFIPSVGWVFHPAPTASPKESMEIATMLPGTGVHAHFQATFDMALGDVSAVAGRPVIPALQMVRNLVEQTLNAFERRFFS